MKEKEPCQYCGKPTGNKPMHEKYCIKNPDTIKNVVPTQESQSSSAVPPIHTGPASPSGVGTPDTLPKVSWLDKVMGKITPTHDPMDGYKNFFGKMPKFEAKPPGFFKKLLLKKGVEYKNFVFVDKDGCGEVAFLPYDVAKERVVVDKVGYWPIKVKGETIFLSKEKLLPLADAPDLSRFQNSANYVWSVYNGGYQEGISQRFDELMDEINKDRIFKWICLAVAVLALVALAITSYTDGRTINALVSVNNIQTQQLINLTKVH